MNTNLVQPSKQRINLSRLTEDQLIAELDNINEQANTQIERIEMQAALWRWRILWELRKRFKSDKLFGQYLSELRAERGIYIGTGSVVNREIHAGRFCEMYKIASLEEMGISKSTVYALSRPMNKEVAGEVLHYITKKNIPYVEVEKILKAKTKPVEAIESTAKTFFDVSALEKQVYLVQNNQIVTGVVEIEEDEEVVVVEEPVHEVTPAVVNDGFSSIMNSWVRHTPELTDEQMLQAVLDLLDSFKLSFTQKLVLVRRVQNAIQAKMYPAK